MTALSYNLLSLLRAVILPMSESSEYYQYNREDLISFIPEKYTKVLEIGCGEGNFWNLLKDNEQLEIWGVEPNQNAAIVARPSAHQLYECSFDECVEGLPNNYFDLIICNDVIEHIYTKMGDESHPGIKKYAGYDSDNLVKHVSTPSSLDCCPIS